MARRFTLRTFATVSLLLLAATGNAQRLASTLPVETVFAIGTEDLASHEGKLDTFLAEAERLELGETLATLFETDEPEGNAADELSSELAEMAPLDLFGKEAWLAVSISEFNPIPAITMVARLSGEARASLPEEIRRAAEEDGAETSNEGKATIYTFSIEVEDSPFPVLAVAESADVVAVSTNPDVLRGVLRRLHGSGEAGFTSAGPYQSTIGALDRGNLYNFLDLERLADGLEFLGPVTGLDTLVSQVRAAVGTLGTGGGVTRITSTGLSAEGIRLPGSGDAVVAGLTSSTEPASREPLNFVPAEALSISVNQFDATGWWNYLVELGRSSDQLGNPDLDELVMQFTGIDLRTTLFDWLGTQHAVITTGMAQPVEPGLPSDNLLGETVYLLAADDSEAASRGLASLFGTVSAMVSGFADPTGEGAGPAIERREVAGVEITSYTMGPGIRVSQAVVGDWALIGTTDEAIDAAVSAGQRGTPPRGEFGRMARQVPAEALSYGVTDLQAMLGQTGAQMALQLQTFAGMSGGQVDFETLQVAGEKLEQFFEFIAGRAGGAYGYVLAEGDGNHSYGFTEFDW